MTTTARSFTKQQSPLYIQDDDNTQLLIIDLFCGAGGVTQGFAEAVNQLGKKVCKIIACVNHDAKAIESHWANHPEVVHFNEDITRMYGFRYQGVHFFSPEMIRLKRLVDIYRALHPKAKVILWASLECTNFSQAKGGKSRDADSRTLAEHLYPYIEVLDPDYIQIENVKEFMSWGPMIPKIVTKGGNDYCPLVINKKTNRLEPHWIPESLTKGRSWLKWRQHINSYGYTDDWTIQDSANFGAYTSRRRLFGVFAKPGLPMIWPEATHAKNPQKAAGNGQQLLFGAKLHKWKAVKECLDLTNEGQSIFDRDKPLVEKTLERIYAGLVKFVANGDDSFLVKYYSGDPASKCISVYGPTGAFTTTDSHAPVFITKWNSTNENGKVSPGSSPEQPCPTLTVQQRLGVIMLKYHGTGENLVEINGPCSTLTTKDRIGVVLMKYYGKGLNMQELDDCCPTITTQNKLGLVFIARDFSGGGQLVDVDGPMGALLTVPKTNLVTCKPFILSTHFDNVGSSLEEPLPTITANRKYHYVLNPQYTCAGGSINEPLFTLIARTDKRPPYLISIYSAEGDQQGIAIMVYPEDSPAMRKIKIFMAAYQISDIKMRMLLVQEMKIIQGFPAGYVLKGTQADQKKFIGNSVVPAFVKAWAEALVVELTRLPEKVAIRA